MSNKILLGIFSSLPFVPLKDAEEAASLFIPRVVRRKDILLTKGDVANELYFVVRGILRNFIVSRSGKDITTNFATENTFITDIGSFAKGIPSIHSIQAIQDGLVLSISKKDLDFIYNNLPAGDRVGRIMTEMQLERLAQKHLLLRSYSAEERFDNFTSFYPTILSQIPSYMVASFLGISRTTLHRLQIRHLKK